MKLSTAGNPNSGGQTKLVVVQNTSGSASQILTQVSNCFFFQKTIIILKIKPYKNHYMKSDV